MTFMNIFVMLWILRKVAVIFCKYYSIVCIIKQRKLKRALNVNWYDHEHHAELIH